MRLFFRGEKQAQIQGGSGLVFWGFWPPSLFALKGISVRGFRNLADQDLGLPLAGCVVSGPNGHGKTNLIEALLFCETFRSFRGARDTELVRFGAEGFRVEVGAQTRGRADAQSVAAGYDARTKKKRVTVDGAEPERIADAIGLVRGVVLSPGDVQLIAGEPRERRRYLDVLLALTVKGYLAALSAYRRALQQRLKARAGEAAAFEALMAESGAAIWSARRCWAGEWREKFSSLCAAMGETGASAMNYAPRSGDDEASEPGLRAALERSRERDRELGRVSVGPHRDELRLVLSGRSLRRFGSAGQQRTAAIALRLIAAATLSQHGGSVLLCLDDAFAELDDRRSRCLGQLIEAEAKNGRQIVAAVPKDGDVPDVVASLPRWTMKEGVARADA